MYLHHSFTTRPATLSPVRYTPSPVVIRTNDELAAYLYAPAAPIPATVRVCAMMELDRKVCAIITGRAS